MRISGKHSKICCRDVLVLFLAVAVSIAYFIQFQKTARMLGYFGIGPVVRGVFIASVCNVGLLLTRTRFVKKWPITTIFLLLPSLLISPIVIADYQNGLGAAYFIYVAYLTSKVFKLSRDNNALAV